MTLQAFCDVFTRTLFLLKSFICDKWSVYNARNKNILNLICLKWGTVKTKKYWYDKNIDMIKTNRFFKVLMDEMNLFCILHKLSRKRNSNYKLLQMIKRVLFLFMLLRFSFFTLLFVLLAVLIFDHSCD